MGKWKFSIERTGYTWTLKWIGDDTIYEEKQSFLGLIGLICAIVLILGISFSYITNYKKVTIDTSNSPDGKYELTLQAVGESD